MLSPEVWKFPPPKSGSRVRTNASEENLIREISDHKFYHNVSLNEVLTVDMRYLNYATLNPNQL